MEQTLSFSSLAPSPPAHPLYPLPQARPNSNLLFVCSEVVSAGFYAGKEKAFMLANCIFRSGARS